MSQRTPMILSRKVQITIERKLVKLINKTYTEEDIFVLLIELREIARNFSKSPSQNPNPKFDNAIKQFIEVADCIAHTNRDREDFLLPSLIKDADERLAIALDKGGNELLADVWKVEAMSGDAITATMLGMIFLYLSAHKSKISTADLVPVFEDKGNISLCIISLLQDTVVNLKSSDSVATLHVLDHEGTYRLYCLILNSRVQQSAQQRIVGDGKLIIGFPVITTNARNIDGLRFDIDPEKVPDIIETFRSSDGQLHVRVVREIVYP